MAKNQRGVVVAYRVVPGEPDKSIIVDTSSLMAEEHDTLIKTVEGSAGQEADEFATVMARTQLPDGANMLARFHTTGKMMKVNSADVEMTPNNNTTISLSELNQVIAEQKGVTIADLAAQYRSQADALFKEAKVLREQAEELVPTKKKTAKKTVESV